MKKNLLIALLTLGISLSPGISFATYKNVSSSNIGEVNQVNMIPTQAQYIVLNTSSLNSSQLNDFKVEISKFKNYNGNVSKFLASGILKKYELSSYNKGENKMNISELKKYQQGKRSIIASIDKLSNSINYSFLIGINNDQFSDNGSLQLGRNFVSFGNDYVLLISYSKI